MTAFLPSSARVEAQGPPAPAAPPAGLDAASLLATLQEQLTLYERLEGLAAHQQRFIAAGEGGSLLDLLAHRQRIIDEIQSIQRVLDADAAHWPSLAPTLPKAQREAIASACERIAELNERITARDRRDEAALADARDRFGDELSRLKQVGRAAKAYGSTTVATAQASDPTATLRSPRQGRFTDQRG